MPGFTFPTVGPSGLRFPTFPTGNANVPSHRYYDPLRLPKAHLGVVRFSLSSPDTLHHSSFFVFLSRERLAGEARASSPRRESSPQRSALLRLILHKETIGSPKFPGYPCDDMPWSQTPVVSWTLALSHPGLLPSSSSTLSAFPLKTALRVMEPQLYIFRGSIQSLSS